MDYNFFTITPAQALAFNPNADSLNVNQPGRNGSNRFDYKVVFDVATDRVSITEPYTGTTVIFGSGLYNREFSDGVAYGIGSPGADYYSGAWFYNGGPGDDVIVNADHAYGGAGADTFGNFGGLTIYDWDASDRLYQAPVTPTAAKYTELTAATELAALAAAGDKILNGGFDYVSVAVGKDVYVYSNPNTTQLFGVHTVLANRTLDDIRIEQIIGTSPVKAPPPPVVTPPVTGVTGSISGNMDAQHLNSLTGALIGSATSTKLILSAPSVSFEMAGVGLTYDSNQQLTGGTATSLIYRKFIPFGDVIELSGMNASASDFSRWVAADATQTAFATLLAGNDRIYGGDRIDLLRGYAGNDVMQGGRESDTLYGGAGNDWITGGWVRFDEAAQGRADTDSAANYLRGEEGDDSITGGAAFDDINGNQGNDVAHGMDGADWVVGGQDQDLLFGDNGNDIVYGNLGNDTCYGGDGDDWVRGGQGNDIVEGGFGNDWLWGDRGNDTVTGGFGADLFHSFSGAGVDRITDFKYAEGDRVILDDRTAFTIAQAGADAVITIGGVDQVILVGVSASSLASDAVSYA